MLLGGVPGVPPAEVIVLGGGVVGMNAAKMRAMVATMKKGAVVVDVAVDQGGCIETSHVTTHSQPTFEVDGVLHYCVANMPGAVPRTSTFALTNVTLPYLFAIAGKGLERALVEDASLVPGVNTIGGRLTCPPVGEAQGLPVVPLASVVPALAGA